MSYEAGERRDYTPVLFLVVFNPETRRTKQASHHDVKASQIPNFRIKIFLKDKDIHMHVCTR